MVPVLVLVSVPKRKSLCCLLCESISLDFVLLKPPYLSCLIFWHLDIFRSYLDHPASLLISLSFDEHIITNMCDLYNGSVSVMVGACVCLWPTSHLVINVYVCNLSSSLSCKTKRKRKDLNLTETSWIKSESPLQFKHWQKLSYSLLKMFSPTWMWT